MKFIEAKWYTKTNGRNIRLLVIHDMEAPERETTAEAVARMFQTTTTKKSAHYCFDNDSEVQCVLDKDVAYAAPGSNNDGLHFELAGYAHQSTEDWRDRFSLSMLSRAAIVAYNKCVEYDIPVVSLSKTGVASGRKGITTHAVISDTYHRTTHTDPGPNFPMGLFIEMIKAVPLLNQPRNQVIIMSECIAARRCPVDGGFQKAQADGGVFNTDGCQHYHGSYLEPGMAQYRNNPDRKCVDIIDNPATGPDHYTLIFSDGATYDSPMG